MYRAAGEKKPLRNFELYELLQKVRLPADLSAPALPAALLPYLLL
jgi:hypothetical protein